MDQPVHKKKVKSAKEIDLELAEYLKVAEDALIGALGCLSGPLGTQRRVGYQEKLNRAQEAITALRMEELVLIRGPHRPPKPKKPQNARKGANGKTLAGTQSS